MNVRDSGWHRLLVQGAAGLSWLVLTAVMAEQPAGNPPSARQAIRQSSSAEIQALLAQRCFACHGAGTREAGLSFQNRESAIKVLESGQRAIVPGQPESSELLRRVMAADPNERMPPKGAPLSADEIAQLRQWIASGAEWVPHWAYRPVTLPPAPRWEPKSLPGGPRDPLDGFVAQQLAVRGLTGSAPADRRTLLRRVTFDLVGLPPRGDDLEEFLADAAPDAYERAVDRLLARPQLGERWARHWMDVVHFAETHGHDQDRPRPNAWPYRDYLIRAFNSDKPYARFVEEQIAGDVLAPHDPQALIATGLLSAGPWDESSLRDIREDSIDREIGRYLDRDDIVTTVINSLVSTTIHCARCHDHKFDPITQRDYYNLQAVFAATDKADREFDADPAMARRRQDLTRRRATLANLVAQADPSLFTPELTAGVADWERQIAAAARQWRTLDLTEYRSEGGATLTRQSDGSLLASGTRPEKDTYTLSGNTDLEEITGLRLEVLTDPTLPHQGPGRQDNGNLHLNEVRVNAAPRGAPTKSRTLVLRNPRADFNQDGWTIAMAIDGNPATAWGIFPEVGKPHRAIFELAEPLRVSAGVTVTIELEQSHGRGHLIGRPRLSVTSAPLPLSVDMQTLPAPLAAILDVPAEARDARQRAELAGYVLGQRLDRELAALPPPQRVYVGTNQFRADGSFRPATRPRTVRVLHRGDIRQEREVAVPGTLGVIPELPSTFALDQPDDEGARRVALARWISDRRNGLTWRSIVNRIWQYHFGRGIVDTPSDFGAMGSMPTHPELLDWLAVTLQREDGSLKALHRRLVTSATYRQDSAYQPHAATLDADNRWLWRMNRTRLDAESIHDAMAQVAETLDFQMGGPSVQQFIQSPGVHVTPTVDYQSFSVDDRANYRRSVYRFLFRTLPDPFMELLDCPDASQLTPTRTSSITALQALAMLNDKFVVRQSEHLAARVKSEAAGAEQQVDVLFRRVLLRPATAREQEKFRPYVEQHGLANAARWLLNSNEFLFVD